MTDKTVRFRIGLFVLLAMVLLAVLVIIFGSLPTLFKRSTTYTVKFEDAPGIAPGTPVRRSGVRIGEVERLDLDNETGEVNVVVGVSKKYVVRHNEQPTLVGGLLGGDVTIDFIPMKVDPEKAPDLSPLTPGEVLKGIRQATVGTLVSQAADVVPTTQELLNDIRKSFQRVEKLTPLAEETIKEYRDLARNANKAFPELLKTNDEIQTTAHNFGRLSERVDNILLANQDKIGKSIENISSVLERVVGVLSDDNQKNFSGILKNVRTSTDRLPSISANADEMLKETRETIKKINTSLTLTEDLLANLQTATKSLAERGPNIIKNADETTDKLNKSLTDLRDLLKAIGDGDGSLRKFISDPALYNHLDEAAYQIAKIMPRLDRVMKDVEVFADKLARHPESLGLGGVIRPSSGLKDVPGNTKKPPLH